MTTEREKLALEDAHARFHDQPGNMLPAKGCGWERCEFWDAGVEVIKALPNWVTPPEPTDEMVEAAAKAWHETKHRGQRWDAMQEQRRAHWRSVARVALIAALRTPPPEPDEWCREESCEYRHWRSGAIPTHKRFGSQCPAPAPPPVVDREKLAEALFGIYDHGTQPNAFREADALLASGLFLSAGEHAAQVLEEAAAIARSTRNYTGGVASTGSPYMYEQPRFPKEGEAIAVELLARAREHREGTR